MIRLHPVWRGSIEAAAFLVDGPTMHARVVALWRPGTTVHRMAGGLLVRLPAPVRVRAEGAPGLPFVRLERRLVALPLRRSDLEDLGAGPDDLVLARGGRVVLQPAPHEPVDVSAWLDLSGWTSPEVEPLGAPPEPARLTVAAPAEVREALGPAVPASPSPEAAAFLQALLAAREQGRTLGGGGARGLPGGVLGLLGRLLGWLRPRAASSVPTGPAPGRSIVAAPPPGPSAWEALRHRLDDWMARAMLWAGLGSLVGRGHAAWLRNLLDLFDRGDLDEALRHAIPLSERGGGGPERLSLFPPGPRDALRIRALGAGFGVTLGLGPDLFQLLKDLYRRSFEKLKREGRVEEAAFVLAELLEQEEEAVDFLESHGRVRMAAEVAEARELAPGLVVRLWFLAGDPERAIAIARRTGAFADAVARLDGAHPDLAKIVRVTWAGFLAEAGDLAQAVEVAWPVEPARERALTWIDALIEAGGPVGAAMLVKKLWAAPDAWRDVHERAEAVLDGESSDDRPARAALLDAIVAAEAGPPVRSLARLGVRAALRERNELAPSRGGAFWDALVLRANDPVLAADLPTRPFHPTERSIGLLDRDGATTRAFAADEAGPLVVRDALLLPDGRWLVALGEAGVRLLRPDGRTLVRWERPADRLVPSANLARVVLLAKRGTWWRASRLDLVRKRAEDWCEARFDVAAASFDGGIWYVAEGDSVVGIDALAEDWRAIWRVGRMGGPVVALDWSPDQLRARVPLVVDPSIEQAEDWRWELPGPKLRARDARPGHVTDALRGELVARLWENTTPPTVGARLLRVDRGLAAAGTALAIPSPPAWEGPLALTDGPQGAWVAVPWQDDAGEGRVDAWWFPRSPAPAAKIHLRFEAARPDVVRFCGDELVVATSRGHLVRASLVTGAARSVAPRS